MFPSQPPDSLAVFVQSDADFNFQIDKESAGSTETRSESWGVLQKLIRANPLPSGNLT